MSGIGSGRGIVARTPAGDKPGRKPRDCPAGLNHFYRPQIEVLFNLPPSQRLASSESGKALQSGDGITGTTAGPGCENAQPAPRKRVAAATRVPAPSAGSPVFPSTPPARPIGGCGPIRRIDRIPAPSRAPMTGTDRRPTEKWGGWLMVPWQLDWLGSLIDGTSVRVVSDFSIGGFAGGSLGHAKRTVERADLTDRRRLPDRAAAHPRAFLPRRPVRDPRRSEHHRLGRLVGRDVLPAPRRPERHGGRDRVAGDAGWPSSRATRCRCCPRSAGWSR